MPSGKEKKTVGPNTRLTLAGRYLIFRDQSRTSVETVPCNPIQLSISLILTSLGTFESFR